MIMIINNVVVVITTLIGLYILFNKRFRTAPSWHATVTPLASIIGSGFLVSAPLLLLATGNYAVYAMLGIVLFAYALGASLRFNIVYAEELLYKASRHSLINTIEIISRPVLGVAYVISVAFYLKLLSAFALRGMGTYNLVYEDWLTTFLLLFIGFMGKIRGLSMLEFLETYSVNTKLAIISAAILACLFFNTELIIKGQWFLTAESHQHWWLSVRQVFGMLIIIQGFETSRYLGATYKPEMRIKTMRYAQLIASVIYVVFVALTTVIFSDIHHVTETTIIDICKVVAPVLPFFLIVAALMSQFSAAVADTVGSGGLFYEATSRKISTNNSYLLITMAGVILTWLTNIYQIITIASKAFAIYYLLQVLITVLIYKDKKDLPHRGIALAFYIFIAIAMVAIITLGVPVE